MAEEKKDINQQLDHLFRASYSKLISSFLSRFGTENLEHSENAIMEAYYKALKVWPYKGIPDNPDGWLYKTAYRVLLDIFRKQKVVLEKQALPLREDEVNEDMNDAMAIEDPELKLLFLICHPALKKEDQLAFMLKTLAGFGDQEISNALMLKKSTIKKRLLRARAALKEQNIQFEWPSNNELKERLSMVHKSLYLLFNEGFYSSHPEFWIRKDLCLEAMRFCKYLVDHEIGNSETHGLMALMCYHISRYEARISKDGHIVLLADQDRSKWDPYFIKLGNHYLGKSAKISNEKSRYQIEAFISAQHCMAESVEKTNWKILKELYEALYVKYGQEQILLNLVMVCLYLKEVEYAKKLFEQLKIEEFKTNKSIYYMVGLKLYEKLKDQFQVELMLERAIQSSTNPRETNFLNNQLKEIKKNK